MRSLTWCLLLSLCACRQYEVLCSESDRCESPADMLDPTLIWLPVAVPMNTPPLNAITGVAEPINRIYAVGSSATVLSGDGSAAFAKTATSPSPTGALTAIFATANTLWVVDSANYTVHRSTNRGASWNNTNAGALGTLYGIYGQGTSDVLAVGQDTNEGRFYGGSWRSSRYPTTLRKAMYAAWATGNNFYVVGSSGAAGRSADPAAASQPWTDISPTGFAPNFRALWGSSDTNLYAAGLAGAVARYDGTQWTAMNQGPSDLAAIWGSGPNDIWVVGKAATVVHYDGTQWQSRGSQNLGGHHLTGVWGDGRGGIWASAINSAGTSGAVFKY